MDLIATEQWFPTLVNKTVLFTSGVIGATNFVVADLLTDNKGLAIILCAFSTLATAYFTSRPRVIAAQAAREATRHVNAESSNAALIARLHYEIDRKTVELGLLRISKHKALEALQAAYWHHDEVSDLCKESAISIPPLRKVGIGEIFGEEDAELKKMIKEIVSVRATQEASQT